MSNFGKKMIIFASVLVVLAGAIYFFFMSPVFEVKTIDVEGNLLMSDVEVIDNVDVHLGDNIFLLLIHDATNNQRSVEEMDARLQNVKVNYLVREKKIFIEVTETPLVGYLYYQGTYLWLNTNGLVIHSGAPDVQKGLTAPLLEGITVTEFQLGGTVSDNAKASLNAVTSVIGKFKLYRLDDEIKTINVRDLSDIVVSFDSLEIHLGSNTEISRKANILFEFLEETPDARGIIHLEDLNGQLYYEPAK